MTVERAVSLLPPDQNFQVMTSTGPLLLLRNRYAKEVAQHPRMSLSAHIKKTYFADYPGFEGTRIGLEGHIHDVMREAVTQRMTQALGSLVEGLVEETAHNVQIIFGECSDWTSIEVGPAFQDLICRMTSRVLVGKRLCRDEDWIRTSKEYLACSRQATISLSLVPGFIRPVGHWFVPACSRLRALVRKATLAIQGELAARAIDREAAVRCGDKLLENSDAITWLCNESSTRGRRLDLPDLVSLQLGLSVAANHTTTEALIHAVCHLCEHPDITPRLRDEICKVVGQHGWSKTSFQQLRQLDSFLLESQRHSRGPSTMLRIATDDVALSNGFVVKKGTPTQILTRNFDPLIYDNPSSFISTRFLDLRAESEQPNKWQFVTASPEQMGFGLGPHACPGRFYVANELKLLLAQLLLKYDWRLDPEYGEIKRTIMEGFPLPDYAAKLQCKRRKEEIDIDRVAN